MLQRRFEQKMELQKLNLRKTRSKFNTPLSVLCFTLLLAPALSFASSCPKGLPVLEPGTAEIIKFEQEHRKTFKAAVSTLEQMHYSDIEVDDELSKKWLSQYFEFLDPRKNIFLQKDIDRFTKKYATQLDNSIAKADLSPAKEIYDLYRDRITTYTNKRFSLLEDSEYKFNYDTNASLPIDSDDYQYPQTAEELANSAVNQTTLSMLNLKLSGVEEDKARKQLIRRYKNQLNTLFQQKTQDVLDTYVNALSYQFDPHSNYLSPWDSENFEITMSLQLEGIGAVLQKEDELTKVSSLVPGGPAQLGGELEVSDRIVAVGEGTDCEFIDVMGWNINDVVERIRGKKDTQLRLKVIPAKEDAHSEVRKIVTIIRDKVKLEDNATKGEIIEVESDSKIYNLGVIDIPSFYMDQKSYQNRDPNYASTTRDVKNLIDEFTEKNVDGIIIDLRQNGGGLLYEAATLTDLFIDQGPVVQIRNQKNRIDRRYRARFSAYYTGPLVVLIDRTSASASEIFAGAIQDYGRGLIIGSQSFGKGTVQSIQGLPAGQIKITESKYYRISGESTQHRGVLPDVALPSLYDPERVGESSYETALVWDKILGIPHGKYQVFDNYVQALQTKHEIRLKTDADMRFVTGTLEMIDQRRKKKTVSLNEAKRKFEKEQFEKDEEMLENNWYKQKGLPIPVKKDDEDDAETPESNESNTATIAISDAVGEDQEETVEPDIEKAILEETGRIFSDYLFLTNQTKTASVTINENR